MIYIVQHHYASSLGGPWVAGMEMDLPEDKAAHINRSSPGVLKPKVQVAYPPADTEVGKPAARQITTGSDRQVKAAKIR